MFETFKSMIILELIKIKTERSNKKSNKYKTNISAIPAAAKPSSNIINIPFNKYDQPFEIGFKSFISSSEI